jgi:hypothetical protein
VLGPRQPAQTQAHPPKPTSGLTRHMAANKTLSDRQQQQQIHPAANAHFHLPKGTLGGLAETSVYYQWGRLGGPRVFGNRRIHQHNAAAIKQPVHPSGIILEGFLLLRSRCHFRSCFQPLVYSPAHGRRKEYPNSMYESKTFRGDRTPSLDKCLS